MKTVPVDPCVLALCSVQASLASELTRTECADLMAWCDTQTESLWDGMSLQSILNVYRVSAAWITWEDWRNEDFDAAGRAWDRAVIGAGNRLDFPTLASRKRSA